MEFKASMSLEKRIGKLLSRMTVAEKIGQMSQANWDKPGLHQLIIDGRVGSVLNEVDVEKINHLQKLAVEESPLGIPLLVGRDVIHGFKTVFPIPLAQAASWNPFVLSEGARIGALEAASAGINHLYLMLPAVMSASCAFMLPVATAPNAVVFGSRGKLNLLTEEPD